jgi:hypothetical protein
MIITRPYTPEPELETKSKLEKRETRLQGKDILEDLDEIVD